MRRSFHLAGCLAALLLGACAGASRSSEAPGTTPASVVAQGVPGDSAAPRKKGCARVHESLLVQGPVYAACEVDTPPRLTGRPVPFDYQSRASCAQVAFELVIDERGTPVKELARVVQTNDGQLAASVIRSYQASTFTPAKKGGVPVRSVYQGEIKSTGVVSTVVSTRGGSPPMGGAARPPRC